MFIGRTDAKAKTPILWPPGGKNWLIGKDPDAGKYWRWEEKWTTEDEMVGWYHWLDGHEFEQAPGVGDGQGGLACCSPWVSRKESDTTEWLNETDSLEPLKKKKKSFLGFADILKYVRWYFHQIWEITGYYFFKYSSASFALLGEHELQHWILS